MTGAEVDEVIAVAVAMKSIEDEHQRRLNWKRVEESAALFVADEQRSKAKILGPNVSVPTTYVRALRPGDVIYCALRPGFRLSPARK
jgi:hypothetical protein